MLYNKKKTEMNIVEFSSNEDLRASILNALTKITGVKSKESEDEIKIIYNQEDFFKADIVILGLNASLEEDHRLIKEAKLYMPSAKILVVSSGGQSKELIHLFQLGVNGYIYQEDLHVHLFKAIMSIAKYDYFLSSKDHHTFVKEILRLKEELRATSEFTLNKYVASKYLSNRECEVFELILQGKTSVEISKRLYISLSTVADHTNSIFKTFEANNKIQAIVEAIKAGVVSNIR